MKTFKIKWLILSVLLLALFGCKSEEPLVSPFFNEGTLEDPLQLSLGEVHEGVVADSFGSHYRFDTSGLHDASYLIRFVTSGVDLDLYFYRSDDLSAHFHAATCTLDCGYNLGNLSASAGYQVSVFPASGGGTAYSITVEQGLARGSLAQPYRLYYGLAQDLGFDGLADLNGESANYLSFRSGTLPDALLELGLTQDAVAAELYADAAHVTLLQSCPAANGLSCLFTGLSASTDYWLKVYSPNPTFGEEVSLMLTAQ